MIDTRFYESIGPVLIRHLIEGLQIAPAETAVLDRSISGVASLSEAKSGQIAFLQSKKYASDLETSSASACLVPQSLASLVEEAGIVPLISEFPRTHFGRITAKLINEKAPNDEMEREPVHHKTAKIHPTAVVASNAAIGEDVEIGPFCVIGPGVEIGARTKIGSHCSIEFTIMGQDCFIKPHAAIGSRGFGVDGDESGIFDLPHIGRAMIGNRVSVGCHTSIDRGLIGDTLIGDDVKIDNLVQIAHNVTIGKGSMFAGHVGLAGSCTIGNGVLMGGSAGLADHISVGDGARVAAYAGAMKNIPAGEIWSGIPAMPLREHMRIVGATRKLIQK